MKKKLVKQSKKVVKREVVPKVDEEAEAEIFCNTLIRFTLELNFSILITCVSMSKLFIN